MKIVSIIAEYNPFHNGHKYQIDCARKKENADIITVIMSGNCTQRGEPAIADKYKRAEMAIKNGADLVFLLPYPYSSAPASHFAKAGVYIASMVGTTHLCFGIEENKLDTLKEISAFLSSDEYKKALSLCSSKETGLAKTREELIARYLSDAHAEAAKKPNNILAIEYLSAIASIAPNILPIPIKRHLADHGKDGGKDGFSSSSHIRRGMLEESDIASFMPHSAYEILIGSNIADPSLGERAVLSLLRRMEFPDPDIYLECEGGLGSAIVKNARAAKSYDELISLSVSKRHSAARVRRAIIGLLTKTENSLLSAPPSFTCLLGASRCGISYLGSIKKTCSLPILSRPLGVDMANREDRKATLSADELYSLFTRYIEKEGAYRERQPYIER